MTNGEAYRHLSPEEKAKFREFYGEHPLFNYIDWERFYQSSNGNTLDFVKCIDTYTNEDGNKVFVLERIVEDNEDYKLVFVCGENEFIKIPDTDENEGW